MSFVSLVSLSLSRLSRVSLARPRPLAVSLPWAEQRLHGRQHVVVGARDGLAVLTSSVYPYPRVWTVVSLWLNVRIWGPRVWSPLTLQPASLTKER